jgi:hypothetical protein
MLSQFEQKVTAVVADAIPARPGLGVFAAPGPPDALVNGSARVVVALRELTPAATFARDDITASRSKPITLRRVMPLRFALDVRLRVRPNGTTAQALTDARAALLDDVSRAIHALHDDLLRGGQDFDVDGDDPGFSVSSFVLAAANVQPELVGELVAADLRYVGDAEIWPPNVTRPGDEIIGVDVITAAQPLRITAGPSRLAAGGTSTIRIQSVRGMRLQKEGDPRLPLHLAVHVVSDLPPADRGTIANGTAGKGGLKLVTVDPEESVATIEYVAPQSVARSQAELVVVHFATPDKTAGVLLGSVAITVEKA